ncbi:MAG: hypothetical protein NC218_03370 [Acetobacter sp.]|nr:hypothetical protein [Acetobacter sp.]
MKVSNWAEELKGIHLIIFNNYPDIIRKMHEFEDAPYKVLWPESEDEDVEVFQWFIADIDYVDAERLDKRTMGEIKFYYSDVLDLWILPVMHFGTPWTGVPVRVKEEQ